MVTIPATPSCSCVAFSVCSVKAKRPTTRVAGNKEDKGSKKDDNGDKGGGEMVRVCFVPYPL